MKIKSWAIQVEWSNGKIENITEIPDDTAQYIDDDLTVIEKERNKRRKK